MLGRSFPAARHAGSTFAVHKMLFVGVYQRRCSYGHAAALFAYTCVMGAILSYGVKEPKYALVNRDGSCEIRKYVAHQVARASFTKSGDSAFVTLAQYIGVMGREEGPQNATGTRMDMMKPVLVYSWNDQEYMEFVLPPGKKEHHHPAPTNADAVSIVDVPESLYAVIPYSRKYATANKEGKIDAGKIRAKLSESLQRLGYAVDNRRPCKKAFYNMPLLSSAPQKIWVPVVVVLGTSAAAQCACCGLPIMASQIEINRFIQ